MSKARIMGAGLAGSTNVDVNINGNQGGGTKKQGLPGITNMRSSLVFYVNQRAYGTPDSRDKIFYINQLSTIGPKSTMFATTADGVFKNESPILVEQPLPEDIGGLGSTADAGSSTNSDVFTPASYYEFEYALEYYFDTNTNTNSPGNEAGAYLAETGYALSTIGRFTDSNTKNMISTWNTVNVTTMKKAFNGSFRNSFNEDISNWNVRNVKDMSSMFKDASQFNQDLSKWDVSKVSDMSSMFQNATGFNQDLSKWDVSNVNDMSNMFNGASAFNWSVTFWSVKSTCNLNQMFSSATKMYVLYTHNQYFNQDGTPSIDLFNPPITIPFNPVNSSDFSVGNTYYFNNQDQTAITTLITNGYDLSKIGNAYGSLKQQELITTWNTANVDDMSNAFMNRPIFNQDLNTKMIINHDGSYYFAWDVTNVTNMSGMFNGASAFNQDIGNWNTSLVTDMTNMFNGASVFNNGGEGNNQIKPFESWNTYNVTNMLGMFQNAYAFNQDIGNWLTNNVTNMAHMFNGASVFNQDIGTWDVTNVTEMSNMFNGASAFNQDIRTWDVRKVEYMRFMFKNAKKFDQDITTWKPETIYNSNNILDRLHEMFNGATIMNATYGNNDSYNYDGKGTPLISFWYGDTNQY